jgi:metal-responsive CopG/Arc/MetJ family transcriptional regulator
MLNIRLPIELERKLTEEAKLAQKSRSELAREALKLYLRLCQRRRHLARLRQAAAALYETEAYALAKESLPLDNEALAIAEALENDEDNDKWWK